MPLHVYFLACNPKEKLSWPCVHVYVFVLISHCQICMFAHVNMSNMLVHVCVVVWNGYVAQQVIDKNIHLCIGVLLYIQIRNV